MSNNLGKIYSISINEGIITSVSVFIGNTDKYNELKGYVPPRTAYYIGEFNGDDAINTILNDLGIKNISLNIHNSHFGEYSVLSNFLSDGVRININNKRFMHPAQSLLSIKKITLKRDESINMIKLDAKHDTGVVDISYQEYLVIQSIWGEYMEEDILVDNLKKKFVVETFDGHVYNYYAKQEVGNIKIIKYVSTRSDFCCEGVFSVNIENDLLQFTVLEESYSKTRDEIMPKGSVFYVSRDSITYMK